MALNHPYNPRHNAKLYVPKLTEEERLARATPLENLKGLRYRCQAPAAPVEAPIAVESLPQAPAPQDSAPLQDQPVSAPAHEYIPTALEVVCAEFPEIFHDDESRPTVKAHKDEPGPVSNGSRAAAHIQAQAHHYNAIVAKALEPPSAMAYEEDATPAYSNIISFYRRPRRTTALLFHHSSG